MRHRLTPLTLALLAPGLAGCGITNPYQTRTHKTVAAAASVSTSLTSSTTPAADAGDPPGERGGTIPPAAQAAQNQVAGAASAATPQAALSRYASLYVNWTAANIVTRQQQLAAISIGQARGQALQAAASAARDPELTRSQVANHGQLIALTPGQGAAGGEWVLVTREQTTGQGQYTGLPATLHVIYAQLTHTSNGWVVTRWEPQN